MFLEPLNHVEKKGYFQCVHLSDVGVYDLENKRSGGVGVVGKHV